VGSDKIGMDCSIVPLKKAGLFMVSTCDFFFPAVDDPYVQGQIGCCNVLSDMYAMGVVDVDNVLMILAVCREMDMEIRDIVTRRMIQGFNDKCKEAGTECTGGQTVVNPWPIIGGTAMSACTEAEFIRPVKAIAGDVLVLTKPLGTQVAVNLNEWRQLEDKTKWEKAMGVVTPEEAGEAYQMAVELMSRLNRNAAILMHKYGAHACTDVTGFGILGHATNLAQNQEERVDFEITALPIINKMTEVYSLFPYFHLLEGYSAETSGGLLIALPAEAAEAFLQELQEIDKKPAWIIGRVVGARDPKINSARVLNNEGGVPLVIPVMDV